MLVFVEFDGWRQMMRVRCKPVSDLVFEAQEHGHQRQQDIVQRYSEDGGGSVCAQKQAAEVAQKGFEAKDRHKTEKNSDCRAHGNGVRSGIEGQQMANFLANIHG